jgi:hypothetical protein
MRNFDRVGVVDIGIALRLLVRFRWVTKLVLPATWTSPKLIQEHQTLVKEYHKKESLSMPTSGGNMRRMLI